MKFISSVKHQTFALLIGLTLGLSLLYFILSALAVFVVEDAVIEKLIQNQISSTRQHYNDHGNLPPQHLSFIKIYKALSAVPAELRQQVALFPHGKEIFTKDNKHYHYRPLILNKHLGRAQLNYYLIAEVSSLLVVSKNKQVLSLFIFAFFISLVLAIVLAYRFSRHIVSPILQLSDRVKLVASTDPLTKHTVISWPKLKYEYAYLCTTLKNTFHQLDESLKREQAFTTDVSHELRTPLTILSNTLSLIQLRAYKDSDFHDLIKINQEMENTVTILLSLARQDNLTTQKCELKSTIEAALLKLFKPSTNQQMVKLKIESNIQLNANAHLLSLLLSNLIHNAFAHAPTSLLHISWNNNELYFTNEVSKQHYTQNLNSAHKISDPGIKSESSTGIGHGLYLVCRIIEVFGWQYQIEQDKKHFSFILKPTPSDINKTQIKR